VKPGIESSGKFVGWRDQQLITNTSPRNFVNSISPISIPPDLCPRLWPWKPALPLDLKSRSCRAASF